MSIKVKLLKKHFNNIKHIHKLTYTLYTFILSIGYIKLDVLICDYFLCFIFMYTYNYIVY